MRKRRSRRREGEGKEDELCGKCLEWEKVKKERQEKSKRKRRRNNEDNA